MQIVGKSGERGQGPFIILFFECDEEGKVTKSWFETYGCPSMIRCGDWVTKWAVGRELSSLSVLEANDLMLVVGGLPLGKEFCAKMIVEALACGIIESDHAVRRSGTEAVMSTDALGRGKSYAQSNK